MTNQKPWLEQFLSEEQQAALAERASGGPFEAQRATGQAWQALFADIRQHMQRDVHDPAVQALVDRWDALVAEMTRGDESAGDGLNLAYAGFGTLPELPDAPPEVRAWAQSLSAAAAFIEQARAARTADAGR